MNSPIRTLIVDHDDLYRQVIRSLLESADGITAVGEARNEGEAADLIPSLEPDVILVDVDTVRSDDLQAVAQITELCPNGKIIVLSGNDQERLVLDAFRKGAQGHLVKGKDELSELVKAIRAVNRGESVLSPGIVGWILDEMTTRRQSGGLW